MADRAMGPFLPHTQKEDFVEIQELATGVYPRDIAAHCCCVVTTDADSKTYFSAAKASHSLLPPGLDGIPDRGGDPRTTTVET